MDLVKEMAKAIAGGSHGYATQEQAVNGSALACLPVFVRWLQEQINKYPVCPERSALEDLSGRIAEMARKAQP